MKRGKLLLGVILVALCVGLCGGQKVQAAMVTRNLEVDGDEDISYAMQEAFDEARDYATADKRYKIIIPAGVYTLQHEVKIYSNTYLYMKGVTLIRGKSGTMMRFGRESGSSYSRYNGFSNITIEGGTFDGNGKKNNYGSSLLRFAHANNILLKNITFKNIRSAHHVEFTSSNKVTVTGCTFANYYGDKSTNNEALQIDIMHKESQFSRYPKYDDTPCQNITITGCTFKNLQRGVGTHSAVAGSYFTNMVISNNTFDDIDGYAIIATNYQKSAIKNNTIKNSGAGILFRYMVKAHSTFYTPNSGKKAKLNANSNSTISGNKITVTDQKYANVPYGIQLYGEVLSKKQDGIPKGDYRVKKVTVSNNTITMKNRGYGIWLQGASSNTLKSNKITTSFASKCSGGGNGDVIRIMLDSKSNKVTNNIIKNTKNNSKSSSQVGIMIREGATATVTGNTITGVGVDGIAVKASGSATIKNNTITSAKRYGILVIEGGKAKYSGNKIKKCAGTIAVYN